jgi:GGDEF domain-containing protein
VVVLEPVEYAHAASDQYRDLTLVEVSDQLRRLAGPTDLVARIGEDRFGISVFETDAEPAEKACERYQRNFGTPALRSGAAIFNPCEPSTLDSLLESAEANLGTPAVAARAS